MLFRSSPSPTPRPALTTKCQTSLEADTRPPSLPSACQTQQRGPTKASTGRRTVTPGSAPGCPLRPPHPPPGGLGRAGEVAQTRGCGRPAASCCQSSGRAPRFCWDAGRGRVSGRQVRRRANALLPSRRDVGAAGVPGPQGVSSLSHPHLGEEGRAAPISL